MTATGNGVDPATVATPLTIRFDLFDQKCAELGALDEKARAELVEVNRTTLWRWRTGVQTPNLETATRIAHRFDITVEDLIDGAAA